MASTMFTCAFVTAPFPLRPSVRGARSPVATAAPPPPSRRRAPLSALKTRNVSAPQERRARIVDVTDERADPQQDAGESGAVVDTATPAGTQPPQESGVTKAKGDAPAGDASPASSGLPLQPTAGTRCGFVALVGPSNSGKSTLLNQLVGQKVAIVTPRVQTTRCRVAGIATRGDAQLVFLDTPGIFEPGNRFARAMVKAAWRSARDADVVALVVDGAAVSRLRTRRRGRGDGRRREGESRGTEGDGARDGWSEDYDNAREGWSEDDDDAEDEAQERKFVISPELDGILSGLARARSRGRLEQLCIIANKSDLARGSSRRSRVDLAIDYMVDTVGLPESAISVFHTNARDGAGVDDVAKWASNALPQGPWLYAADAATDMSMRQMACECVRETCLLELRHEIAYEISVECTRFDERADGSMRVAVDILVRRDSQKRIVTGRGGEMVKRIGTQARAAMSDMVGGATVHLFVTVKVRPGWVEDRRQYQAWGLDFDA